MVFASPGKIAFSYMNFQLHWYGVCMMFAILAGFLTIQSIAKKFYKSYDENFLVDLALVLIISGLIGARLYYVILDYRYFLRNPNEILAVWHGGLSIHGAILGGIISGFVYIKIHKLKFLEIADLFTFGLVTGQIIGRLGNFFNSEAFGLPCNLPWKLYIPLHSRPLKYVFYEYFHPTFLYEMLGSGIILLLILWLRFHFKDIKSGTIFFLYLVLYSCLRICVESFRLDSVLSFGNIHIAHIASFILILTGITGLITINRKKI